MQHPYYEPANRGNVEAEEVEEEEEEVETVMCLLQLFFLDSLTFYTNLKVNPTPEFTAN